MSERLAREMELAKAIVREAGKIIMKFYDTGIYHVTEKANLTPVTSADKGANDYIVSKLEEHFPDDGIISEEGSEKMANPRSFWLLDPLDGTVEFVNNRKEFSIMLGKVEDTKAVLGVVYLPAVDRLFYAFEGGGAYLEESGGEPKQIFVSNTPSLHTSKILVTRSNVDPKLTDIVKEVPFGSVKGMGSLGLKLCLVANGEYDACIRTHTVHHWGVCASDIILREAKGKITSFYDKPLEYSVTEPIIGGGVVGSNSINHQDVISRLSKFI
ncbi:3'(2'),5'-bisphosphate nucleotidase CysQ [Nanoarchaeota archaeon]